MFSIVTIRTNAEYDIVKTYYIEDMYSDDSFIRTGLFPVDISGFTSFFGLLNRSLVRTWKSVSTLFVRPSEMSGLLEPGLTNHNCTNFPFDLYFKTEFPYDTIALGYLTFILNSFGI